MKNLIFVFLFLVIQTMISCSKNDSTDDPTPTIDENVTVVKNIAYIEGDTLSKHKLDVYYKIGASNMPVILFIPGGAWRQGDKSKYDILARTLDSVNHFTTVVANYQLSNSEDGQAIHPDHVIDVANAFKWVKQNVNQYGGDSSKIFLFGQSAGGHLVSLLASDSQYLESVGCSPADIKGVISMSGAYELDKLAEFPNNELGLTAEEVLMYKGIIANAFGSYDVSVTVPASPFTYVSNSLPPFLIIYSEMDMPGFSVDATNYYQNFALMGASNVEIKSLFQTDYTAQTWQEATLLAAEEVIMADYIGHYAEIVAINPNERDLVPTTWIVEFVTNHSN
jgi:acetyl esterase/lipase